MQGPPAPGWDQVLQDGNHPIREQGRAPEGAHGYGSEKMKRNDRGDKLHAQFCSLCPIFKICKVTLCMDLGRSGPGEGGLGEGQGTVRAEVSTQAHFPQGLHL